MLSELDKEKIRLEESYRAEVKTQLDPEKKKSFFDKVFSFLNSSFTLWLLSAVFITAGVKKYDEYKTKQQENKKLNETVSKLDIEIGYRFSRILVKLFELTDKNPDSVSLSKNYKEDDVRRIALSLNSSKNATEDFLYVEYSTFSLFTLLAEEKRIFGQLGRNDDNLNQVISHITGLEVFYEVQKSKFSDVQAVAISIETNLILPRWKENRFYFLDGNENNPFP